jgi:hypothetical protein
VEKKRVVVQLEKSAGKVEVHHRDTERAEGAQRKEMTESRFEISNSESEIAFLCAISVSSVPLW